MRGYFGIGVERVSKPMNVGNLFRSAHAFGASFIFTIDTAYSPRAAKSDTSSTPKHLPFYSFTDSESMRLPKGCQLVGVELLDEAVELPTFHHPQSAAYVFGPERGTLSTELVARCAHIVRIPTSFSLNVATAGAIIMYDRVLSLGRFARRPVSAQAAPEARPPHVFGPPVRRAQKAKRSSS